MFQKKLLVVAVAGALGAGAAGVAFAQAKDGGVQISGRLYPEFAVQKSSGATPAGASSSTLGRAPTGLNLKSRNSVDASNSRIRFSGRENLGRGMTALWQIETTVALDNTGDASPIANRDSFVGLRGGFGTVRLGNMTTVFKDLGDPTGILGISSGNFVALSNITSSRTSFTRDGSGSFHLRKANSLMYDTPKFGGFEFHAQYSPDEARAGNLNADLWSMGVEYKRGPFEFALAHEVHNDFFGGSNGLNTNGGAARALASARDGTDGVRSKDTGTRATVLYRVGGAVLQANYGVVEFDESGAAAGKFKNYENKRWSMTWQQTWKGTPWRTTAAYGNSSAGSCSIAGGAACTTNGLAGNMLVLAADYSFSRRTALFAAYAKINNGSASVYRNLQNASSSALDPGADITTYAVGIRHNF